MNRIERLRNALAGRRVDHPPFTAWYHFGLQFAPPERVAETHIAFFEAFDLDWLKLMNDYPYPMPPGVESIETAADLDGLSEADLSAQLRVVELVAASLKGRALFVDTIFNAWNTLRRNVSKEVMDFLMEEHPAELERALTAINDNLTAYARSSLERGAAGIFLAVPAAEETLTSEQFERFMRPFDIALLEGIRGGGSELNVLHAHGKALYLDRLLDYPVHAISWSDQEGGPSIEEMRRMTSLALMGGLGHSDYAFTTAAAIRGQVRHAVADAEGHRLLLAPGCSLASYTFPALIQAARDEARR
jgi:uroporphyrinogen decarboxylase